MRPRRFRRGDSVGGANFRAPDAWLDAVSEAVLVVPSVIIPISATPDRNYLINHRHPDAARITIVDDYPFSLDPRLF
ncbi:MAG: hypothetical protein HY060_18950 [Proteobacteria bacterium]|nr:hypothetical protein [Pseudomonadota bacterium]